MQANIFELIDLLVNMSGSKTNLDELKAELDDIELSISKMQRKLDNLEEEMNDDKYFDASSEIVDRNIKISLVKKIQKLNKVKSDITKDLDIAKSDEIGVHDELESIKGEIKRANEYNDIINKNTSDSESYNNMIASENERISNLVTKKDLLEGSYKTIQKKVEYLSSSLNEAEDKISKETERLNEIDNNLSNIKSYIDIDSKEKDEKRYLDIKNQIDRLLTRKDEILNDAVYLAGKIKELITNEQKEEVEVEFNKLLDVVKSIPYMELENDEIEVEKEKLDSELKDYDAEISQKEYRTMDKEFIEERIKYLEESINKINEEIDFYNKKNNQIRLENDELSDKIYKVETQIFNINSSLIDYETYDYEANELPKSVVQASNNKLLEERENIDTIAEKYREDLVNKLNELNLISSKLERLSSEKEEKEQELEELQKKDVLTTKSVNILEEEKDKLKLEKINKAIMNLNYREQFNKSLNSIREEFEMMNSSLEFVDKKTRSKILYEDKNIEITDNIPDEIKISDKKNENSIEEVISEQTIKTNLPVAEDDINDDEQNISSDEIVTSNEVTIDTIPEFNGLEETSSIFEDDNKLRVVEIYDIPNDLTERKNDNFMVNDFQDDDYIDIETAINAMEEN